jgi:exopolysaccharide biosynthesis WecB/TagA/CpsF family protein
MVWPRRYDVLGVDVSNTMYDEAVAVILEAARRRRGGIVELLSVHGLIEAGKSPEFGDALRRFAMVAPDGQPVRWALNWLHGTGLEDRVRGSDLMLRLCARAAEDGVGVYLYGGTRDVLLRLCEGLRDRYRGLRIVGAESPPFRALTPEEDRAAVERIERSDAGLVFIGLGCPKQELFAAAHADRIRGVQLCVGAAFDFLAGTKATAPRWMQEWGLEWLFRLASEPRRLWRRYFVANSQFLVRLGRELVRRKLGARSRAGAVAEVGSRAGDAG